MAKDGDDFPWRQLGVLAICRLAEPVAFVSITAYAYVMVQDINGEKDASFYAGLLVSAFALAEACTAWFWGDLSDRFGRKPIILVALAGTALSSLIFGFAKNYWVALIARVVGGALNGNVAVMQTMVAEIATKPEWEPKAYALQPFMWSVGSIAGSALGGFTAQPAKYYPQIFNPDGIFGQFPYLLPNLLSIAVIVVAFILGALFLEETNPAMKAAAEEESAKATANEVNERTPLNAHTQGHLHAHSSSQRERRGSTMSHATRYSSTAPFFSAQVPMLTDPNIDLRRASIASLRSSVLFRPSISNLRAQASISGLRPQGSISGLRAHAAASVFDEDSDSEGEESHAGSANSTQSTLWKSAIWNRGVVYWTVALWILCYHTMAFSSLLPIYLLDDPQADRSRFDLRGGLGQTLPDVGVVLAVNSVVSLVIQGFLFPLYVEKVGVYYSTVSALIAAPIVYAIVPFISLLAHPTIGLYAVLVLQSLFSNLSYPTLLILIKNACSSTQVLGRVNGIAMSGCSGARTLAPPIAGIFYSTFGSAGAWWCTAIAAVLGLVELYFAPRTEAARAAADEEAREIYDPK